MGFLSKLLGERRTHPAHLAEPLADLNKLASSRPSLLPLCQVLVDILPELFSDTVSRPAPSLDSEKAVANLNAGIPLLRGETVEVDRQDFARRWLAVCRAVEKHQEGAAARALARLMTEIDPPVLLGELLAGRPEAVPARAQSLDLEPSLTATVLRLTAFPLLAGIAGDLAPVRHGTPWEHGYCPTCGSWPLLAEFRGLEQNRILRCALCASSWDFPRLLCPFCANRDHRLLGYFHVEDEQERFRAATCDACHGYVKTVSTLSLLLDPQLLVMDLATLHLDLAAADRGYFVGVDAKS